MNYPPIDAQTEARIRESFSRQKFMLTLGARLESVQAGEVSIAIPFREDLTQQNGYLHAGVAFSVIDSACGYAAYTLMPENSGVLSVENKINMLAPAEGDHFVATGRVVKAGKTITVCTGELRSGDTICALLQGTMITRLPR